MNDKMTPSKQSDEEYQFSPEAEQAATFEAAPSKASIFERIKRKNVIIALGAIVIIFCIYKLVDVLFMSGAAAQRVNRPAKTAQLSAPAIQEPPAATKPDVTEVPVMTTSKLADRLNSLESQNSNLQAKLDKLDSQLPDMQNTLSTLGTQVSNLNNALQTLMEQFAKQQAQVLAQQQAAQKKTAKQKAVKPPPVYYVRAMVPGRAWLVTGEGSTLTVGVGDKLPGYGVVQGIDASQGTLTTSVGAIIGHNPDDM